MTTLRDRHRQTTRQRILDAVHEVLAEESPATLSIPRVAARAGTSLRTVYRYFPTKEALVDAASRSMEATTHGAAGTVRRVDDLAGYLRVVWGAFAENVGSVRAQHLTPAGRELRMARLPRGRAGVEAVLREEGVDLPPADLDRLTDIGVLLVSSTVFLELTERLGHDVDEAARLAAWTTAAVIDKAKREGTVAR